MSGSVTTLVGAQYGSEGKGLVAEKLAHEFDIHVRTGAPNAGHTFYVDNPDHGRTKFIARSVPCGWVNPEAMLAIGPGGLIDLDLLADELAEIRKYYPDITRSLLVDYRCGLINKDWHHKFEGGTAGEAHRAIGSTGEGVGPARIGRLARGTIDPTKHGDFVRFEQVEKHISWLEQNLGILVGDVPEMLDRSLRAGKKVLLEGTQGSGLSVITGPWPFVTSTDTNSAQLMADAGVAPGWFGRSILVARTYPIRVAGNSGPLRDETTWEEVGVPEERTTVTKKVRRVGEWDLQLVKRAVALNRPAGLAITFMDYKFPDAAGITRWVDLPGPVKEWIELIELQTETMVSYVGTGPDSLAGV